MSRSLTVDPGDAAPIWRQIEQGVRRLVASGALRPGSPVPSVRELSLELRVNPATVAKAYQRLTQAGVLAMRRGEGTFVADSPPARRVTAAGSCGRGRCATPAWPNQRRRPPGGGRGAARGLG